MVFLCYSSLFTFSFKDRWAKAPIPSQSQSLALVAPRCPLNFKTNPLFVALVAFALLFVTNVAQAGRRPQTEQEACASQCRVYEDACVQSACEMTCASPSGIEYRAGGRESRERSYGNFYEEVCKAAPIMVVTSPPAVTRPVQAPPATSVPNLPPQWLQAAVDLRAGTDAVERMAADTAAMRVTVELLAVKIDRLKAVQVARASASRPQGSSSTATSTSSTPALSVSEAAELRTTWAECERMRSTMEASYVLYGPLLIKCAWVGGKLGVH